ncbi:CHAD domain-containing protein [Sneathiella marina]|uniref:CHAD domain-containing protein n=1 Tax=Sneathiella marina TaxID=2950108 RepID=A0ABY4W0X2_9PROT|nr:CHAD domain-containing protein [Sneathiella marina]USG60780.1 CHAD domain-containing protein [Sneathiella marina]
MTTGKPVTKLVEIDLKNNPDLESAAKLIFHESAHHLEVNILKFRETGDPMALMQIRIGLRRIRVAMRVFRLIIPTDVRAHFKREFRYFGNMLGEARNMDVFLYGMLSPNIRKKGLRDAYLELRKQGEQVWKDELDIITKELSGSHFERLFSEFQQWLNSNWSDTLGKSACKKMASPVVQFALETIEEGNIELLNLGPEEVYHSVEDLHELRKFTKRSRYNLRFFSSLFKEEKVKEGFDILVKMQDCLGHINDVKEGLHIMADLSSRSGADYFSDILLLNARIIKTAGKEVDRYLDEFEALWARYQDFSLSAKDLRIND